MKWTEIELMLFTSSSAVALTNKIVKSETQTVIHAVVVPKGKLNK